MADARTQQADDAMTLRPGVSVEPEPRARWGQR